MISNEFINRVGQLFPSFANKVESLENANSITPSTDNLFKTVANKSAESVKKILAPVSGLIMDVSEDLQVSNPNATPTISVEVIKSMGEALVNPTDFTQSDIESVYVDVKTKLIARPFTLSAYDIMHGERVESKVKAACEAVAQGVVKEFANAITAENIAADELEEMNPEQAAKISGAFDEETATLVLTPSAYSTLVPTSNFGIDPANDGAYGIGHIYKSAIMPTNSDAVAMTADAVAGALATFQVVDMPNSGIDVQSLGLVGGIPMVLRTEWTFNQTLRCSVETLAGFKVTDKSKIKRYTVAD